MQEKHNIEKELQELGIDIPKQSHNWTLPDNYFAELEQNVLSETVDQIEPTKAKVIPFNIRKVMQLAAACLLLAGLAYFGLQSNDSEQIAFSSEEANFFIDDNIEDFDNAELIEYLTDMGAEPLFSANELDTDQEFNTYFEDNILDDLSEEDLNTLL